MRSIAIPGFPDYTIYEDGSICDDRKVRFLKINNNDGYCKVRLCTKDSIKYRNLHRLLAESFIPNPDNLPAVDHIDRDKTNNNLSNLRWVTNSDNIRNHQRWDDKTSKHFGVFWHKPKKKWVASTTIGPDKVYLGSFDTELEAHEAYQSAKAPA